MAELVKTRPFYLLAPQAVIWPKKQILQTLCTVFFGDSLRCLRRRPERCQGARGLPWPEMAMGISKVHPYPSSMSVSPSRVVQLSRNELKLWSWESGLNHRLCWSIHSQILIADSQVLTLDSQALILGSHDKLVRSQVWILDPKFW